MSTFQLVFTGVCIVLVMVGVAVFATFNANGGRSATGTVVVWGSVDQNSVDQALQVLKAQDKSFQGVTYIQKNAATYNSDLVNAMASGQGPDLFFASQEQIGVFADKLQVVPYSAVSRATFTDSFVDEGQLFLSTQGSLALPIFIDPLVMYWNRDMFATAGFAAPPKYWNGFLDIASKVTVKSNSGALTKSLVALGGWGNVLYAKEIISALVMQAGDPILARDATGSAGSPQAGALRVVFGDRPQGATENPAVSALKFYTEFANPSKTSYSWNNAMPKSIDAFAAGDLAVYFGLSSDYATLVARNPNLHFAVALLPQIEGNATHVTFGELTGVAVSRTAANPAGALTIAKKLGGQAGVAALAEATGLPPVRRDVLQDTSANAPATAAAQSALIAAGWLDPNAAKTDVIFQSMIESVVSGKYQPDQAVSQAAQALRTVLQASPAL